MFAWFINFQFFRVVWDDSRVLIWKLFKTNCIIRICLLFSRRLCCETCSRRFQKQSGIDNSWRNASVCIWRHRKLDHSRYDMFYHIVILAMQSYLCYMTVDAGKMVKGMGGAMDLVSSGMRVRDCVCIVFYQRHAFILFTRCMIFNR